MSSMNCADTEEKTFNIVDIRAIIESCGENGVSYFKYKGLEIDFHSTEKPISVLSTEPHPEETEATQQSILETVKEFEEDRGMEDKAEELMNMHIENPQLYEQIMANPEIIEDFEAMLDDKELDP